MPRCKSCGDEIAFVKTSAGRWMPVNGLDYETYHLHLQDPSEPQMTLCTENGAVFSGRIGRAYESGTTQIRGREVHWATCSHAEQHRRK